MNIYSVSSEHGITQLKFFGLAMIIFTMIMIFPSYIYDTYAPIFYGIGLILLLGLFAFGKEVSGAKAWYRIGTFGFQPVELAKISTAMMLGNYLSNNSEEYGDNKFYMGAAIIGIPSVLIILQPDPGSLLVFGAFVIAMYREGLSGFIFMVALFFATIFILSLIIPPVVITICVVGIIGIILYKNQNLLKESYNRLLLFSVGLVAIATSFSTNFVFQNVLKQHHRERIMVLFEGEAKYRDTSGYNLLYSKTAIGSGRFFGKGFNEGTVTDGRFVPEQHTDYIFCTVGEEWGFLGSTLLFILYGLFIARIFTISENQINVFNRVVGYSFGSIFLIHFFINIAMVTGLFPTVGIPLPLFSYGGSSLWGFSIQVFLLLKLNWNTNS
ncbi:MAG: rod shape-determining protein RodA [Flavobacteriaceae bacterium]|nr:MAG: rod shape-determining protein RodA [Flavobacteriaceae bacterium]